MTDSATALTTGAHAPRSALVLYAAADEAFVRGFLVPALGTAAGPDGQAVALDARDPLTMAAAELDQALHRYAVVVPVISAAFLADPWTRASELMATDATKGRPELVVIPLVLEQVALPTHIAYKMTLGFADRAAWDGQAQRLRDYLARPAAVEPALPCPYPGMRPFQAADAKYFRGRTTELSAIRTKITAGDREIYLIGPSGSGKSSLVNAGVLPTLEAPVVTATMRPGDHPLRQLAAALEAADGTEPSAMVAAWAARHAGARLVLFVDQLEELFAQAPREAHHAFALALAALRAEPRCLILLALRADFYGELQLSTLWTDAGRNHIDLPPLRGAALREAIVEPARGQGVYLETALTERLLADAAGEPGVLPLLQETLVQLWGHRQHCLLTLAAYDALGAGTHSGLAVAITQRADRCLAEMSAAQAALARLVLLRLVSFGEGRPNTRRRQTRAQLASGVDAAAFAIVLRSLIDARLVTIDQDEWIDLCHEILITAWPSFATWIESRRADEQRRRHVQASAEAWIARGRGSAGLLDAGELATAVVWRTTDAAQELGESPEVTQLIDRSRRALTRARWLRRAAAAAIIAIGLVIGRLIQMSATASGEALRQGQRAAAESTKAIRALAEQYRELGRQALVEGHRMRAIPFLIAARDKGIDDVALRALFHAARPDVFEHVWPGMASTIAYHPDGREIAIGGAAGVQRYDATTGLPSGPLLPQVGSLRSLGYSADGAHLVTIEKDNHDTAWLWDLKIDRKLPTARPLHHDGISSADFSPDGHLVITTGRDHLVRLWNADTGAVLHQFEADDEVRWAVLDRDNSRLAILVNRGPTGILNVATGKSVAQISGTIDTHPDLATSMRFSDDGAKLVTTGYDKTMRFWDARTGKQLGKPTSFDGDTVIFSPDGKTVVSSSIDHVLRRWDVATHEPIGPPQDIGAVSTVVYFTPDGERVIALCRDWVVRVWTFSTDQIDAIELEAPVTDIARSPDGTRLLLGSGDATRLLNVGYRRARLLMHYDQNDRENQQRGWDAAFSPDGAWVLGASFDTLRAWRSDGAPAGEVLHALGIGRITFDRAGDRAMYGSSCGVGKLIQFSPLRLSEIPSDPRAGHWETGTDCNGDVLGFPAPVPALSSDGKRMAMLGRGYVRVWDPDTGHAISPPIARATDFVAVRFLPDDAQIATISADRTAQLWDARTGAKLGASFQSDGELTGLEISPDGRWLALISKQDDVTVWDLTTRRVQLTIHHADSVVDAVFSPDSRRVLTYSFDKTAKLVDVATGALVVPELRHAEEVISAAFSPDGARIATVSARAVQLWDATTGRPLDKPMRHPDDVRAAVFSPDGNTLLTSAIDGIRLWDIAADNRSLDDWRRALPAELTPQLKVLLDVTPSAEPRPASAPPGPPAARR